MSAQLVGVAKHFLTTLARELRLAVHQHVLVQPPRVLEHFPALVAHKVVLLAVDLQVDIQRVRVGEDLEGIFNYLITLEIHLAERL